MNKRLPFRQMAAAAAALCVTLIYGQGALAGEAGGKPHGTAALSASVKRAAQKEPFDLRLRLDLEPHWHVYWKNPGDSGVEMNVQWEAPAGVSFSPIRWQPPHRLPMPPLMNYGYEDRADYVVTVTPPPEGFPEPSVTVKAKASWLICNDICIPEKEELTFTVPTGAAAEPSLEAPEIAGALAASEPPELTGSAALAGADAAEISIPLKGESKPADVYFFPEENQYFDHAAPQEKSFRDGKVILKVKRAPGAPVPAEAKGIVELTDEAGVASRFRLAARVRDYSFAGKSEAAAQSQEAYSPSPSKPAPGPEAMPEALPPSVPPPPEDNVAFLITLVSAFLGGLILNAMPCVFPVLSLKILAVSKKASADRAFVRAGGFAYAAGCISAFTGLGGAFMLLRSAGAEIGWGFQMQSPPFVAGTAALFCAVGFNLLGLLPFNRAFNIGDKAAAKEGVAGSFFTGLLAVLVAAPCTAPFMAAALGAALTLPPLKMLPVFAFMGAGLAAPYVALTLIPGALRFLPRPGLWMEHLKHALAFPMFLSSVWLLWVLAQQTGPDRAFAVLAGLISFGACLWCILHLNVKKPVGLVFLAVCAAGAVYPFIGLRELPPTEAGACPGKTVESDAVPFTSEALPRAEARGPVFLYATAAWCITCKVNERGALASDEVRQLFKDKGVTVMRADWTRADPKVTELLARFGRNGVPMYVFFPGRGAKSVLLPQALTPSIIAAAVNGEGS